MKKEVFEFAKKELLWILALAVLGFIIFKIAFFRENSIVVFRYVISLFWLFVLPGYSIMLYWKDELDFIERIVIGIAIALGLMGISSYYIGLMGINLKYHWMFLPIILMACGFIIAARRNNRNL